MFQLPSYALDIIEYAPYYAKLKAWHPSKRRFSCLPDYTVVIPVKDEQKRLTKCLSACKTAMEHSQGYGHILLIINNSEDNSLEEALKFAEQQKIPLDILDVHFPSELVSPGLARALGFDLAAPLLGPRGVIFSTDADSYVDKNFIHSHLEIINFGGALSCGSVRICPQEKQTLPHKYCEQIALEENYIKLALHLDALIDPDPFNPNPVHKQQSGANFALALHAYNRLGGFPKLSYGEDRLLVERLMAQDLPVIYNAESLVYTSARLKDRAPTAITTTIEQRLKKGDYSYDTNLEAAHLVRRRAQLRAIWRESWQQQTGLKKILAEFGLSEAQQEKAQSFYNFGASWQYIESLCPFLESTTMKISDLPQEMSIIENYIQDHLPEKLEPHSGKKKANLPTTPRKRRIESPQFA